MRERCEGEEKRNRAALAKVEPVIYGGIIQLYHVKSGKFVSIVPNMGGKHDKESRLLEVPRPRAGGEPRGKARRGHQDRYAI